MLEEAE
jgi:hypothetical protein